MTSILSAIKHPVFEQKELNVFIKRDDLIHPIISGNKWRKLKHNLLQAKAENKNTIISFGGAFSNHIHALAYACKINDLNCIGIIRGEQQYQNNFTLSWAKHWGMQLKFVDRKTYKLRNDENYLQALQQQYPQAMIVPEGGSNTLALEGVAEVITELLQQVNYDYLLTPVGSGGTLAGLIKADSNQHKILGIAVLKQDGYLKDEVNKLLGTEHSKFNNWQIMNDFHRGGYGKYKTEDASRILDFINTSGIPFEPVYSGKMILALLDLITQDYFPKGATIVLLHTGGIQGLGGMAERGLIDASLWPVPNRVDI
ncbi:1-aminocyclopropane-1-carboxylate deaminase/D-cysteine desulfhydrase [Thalassomonas sp. M1454]|uniref:1-aminocyclopropane-1-carboxylate deaminase/D-cysteine desulfhydrase n=1 Tax=Thalassomonas sp. M1454 TaxID=2594477 RepID=UPI00117C22D5|nr:pyridoxal-phosphate dependent enzyme [Thalassomonas sp. M1454]TRX52816.1 1-aminocyclopropane-1-carboxylate deaminase/D-cysteine desulfhydrase [Thalassomonas sp. M1454]